MSESRQIETKALIEGAFERLLFLSRWLMAPIYGGLTLALASLVVVFFTDAWHEMQHLFQMTVQDAILMTLSLIDISLVGNLLLIVIFAGYENFVSKIDTGDNEDRPDWMGAIGFGTVKTKLVASIVAISAIALLKQLILISEGKPAERESLLWMVVIQLTFVVSGLLMALMDKVSIHKKAA